MTEERLQVIKDRLAKATPGPWEAQKEGMTWDVSVKDNYLIIADDCSEADANLIATAPTDIAALIAEVTCLKRDLLTPFRYVTSDGWEAEFGWNIDEATGVASKYWRRVR